MFVENNMFLGEDKHIDTVAVSCYRQQRVLFSVLDLRKLGEMHAPYYFFSLIKRLAPAWRIAPKRNRFRRARGVACLRQPT